MSDTTQPQPTTPQPTRWNRLALTSLGLELASIVIVGLLSISPLGASLNPLAANTTGTVDGPIPGLIIVIIALTTTIIGIVLGHKSRAQQLRNLRGRGMGTAGLILGYVYIGLSIISIIFTIIGIMLLIATFSQGR